MGFIITHSWPTQIADGHNQALASLHTTALQPVYPWAVLSESSTCRHVLPIRWKVVQLMRSWLQTLPFDFWANKEGEKCIQMQSSSWNSQSWHTALTTGFLHLVQLWWIRDDVMLDPCDTACHSPQPELIQPVYPWAVEVTKARNVAAERNFKSSSYASNAVSMLYQVPNKWNFPLNWTDFSHSIFQGLGCRV